MAKPLLIDDDAKMLRESAGRFFAEADTLKTLRSRRDARDLAAVARGEWDGMVALGLSGLLIPEAFGGSGLGAVAGIQVSEMMGRSLAAGPYLSSAVMAATVIARGDDDALKTEVVEGLVVAIAGEESARHNPSAIAAKAVRDGGGYRLTGRKWAVIDGNIAEKLIVPAYAGDELLLCVVDAAADGVTLTAHIGVDSHPLVEIAFENVRVAGVLCAADRSAALLDQAYDIGRLHLAAEMLGAAQEAFDRTVDYLKIRTQFGRLIGEFQALQHRAAIMFGELEVARSVVLKAAMAYDANDGKAAELISLAKARVGEIAKHVTTEAVQLHGGIGMTDDFDLGFYLKRVRALSERLGDTAFHAERYARLRGL
jgi:alkylation response protein AidB-like acyl-CoA dehydrogenase